MSTPSTARILYVTDRSYPSAGRDYGSEDTHLVERLRDKFDLTPCDPVQAPATMGDYDVVVIRNSGPVARYPRAYRSLRANAVTTGQPVYNQLTGRADMLGKGYLLELTSEGYPVIPTIADPHHLDALPNAERYVVKPLTGADSIGLEVLTREAVLSREPVDVVIQPLIDLVYEVSFYFVDHQFLYALYTPDRSHRWELAPYAPSAADLAFAEQFIAWNDIDHGIQRVDAGRTRDGKLLLIELEDLNPFLSLDRTTSELREKFVTAFSEALVTLLARTPSR